jgi:antitoxin component YwqK of YwqJK toxin-antitoxin module
MKEATNIPQVPFRYLLDDIPYTGSCEEYYPDMNQLYMRINYRDGILQGYSSYFNKDGSTLLIQKYENGELISAIN